MVALEFRLGATVRWFIGNEPSWRGVMDGTYRHWITKQYCELAAS